MNIIDFATLVFQSGIAITVPLGFVMLGMRIYLTSLS